MLCDHRPTCSHICNNAPEGIVCSCPLGLNLQPDRTTCKKDNPCDVWGVCSQNCSPFGSIHKCSCRDGYKLESDGISCKSTDPAIPYAIFSNRHELRGIELHSFSVKSLISSLKNTIALDFFHQNGTDIVSIFLFLFFIFML